MIRYRHPYAVCAVLTAFLAGSGFGEVRSVLAENKPSTKQARGAADHGSTVKPKSNPVPKSAAVQEKEGTGRSVSDGRKKARPKEPSASRVHRRSKGAKRLKPQIVVTPKPDLSHHGMLEQPQRYSPHYEHAKGGTPNPNTGALLHEHFQELDKNRDGSIDPLERALGRLDIDRDLADRQWQ